MLDSTHGKQFLEEVVALNKTEEFKNLTKFVEEMTTKIEAGGEFSESYTTFKDKYLAQI